MNAEVEETNPAVGTFLDDSVFAFHQEERRNTPSNQGEGRRNRANVFLFNAPSQTFASLVERRDTGGSVAGGDGQGQVRRYVGTVPKAISIYETNAKVISGTMEKLGTSVRLTL